MESQGYDFKNVKDEINKKIIRIDYKLKDSVDEFEKDLADIENEIRDFRKEANIKPPLKIIKPKMHSDTITNVDKDSKHNRSDKSNIIQQYDHLSKSDLIMSVLAGMAGIATSWALRYDKFGARKIKDGSLVSDGGIFADIHDGNYRKELNPIMYKIQELFKHPNNPFDKLEGAFHRLRYGHDIFNWNQTAPDGTKLWAEMIKKYGNVNVLPFGNVNKFLGLLNTIGKYFALYIFDSFSKEGLPLPFSSYFNKKTVNVLGEVTFENSLEKLVKGNQEIYSAFLTIKARDVSGTALTTSLLKAYREIQRARGKQILKNQKYYEMNCIAYFTLFAGCLSISAFDLKTASLNYTSLGVLLKNVIQLNLLVSKNRKIINIEYEKLLMESLEEIEIGKSITELLEEKDFTETYTIGGKLLMEFKEYDIKSHKFTYHPETTPSYFLPRDVLEDCIIKTKAECESERDYDTLHYIKVMENAHSDFCNLKITVAERRKIIEEHKKCFINKYGDKPQHANRIYDKFYSLVNGGRW